MDFLKKNPKKIIIGLVIIVAALLIFRAGIFVGYHRAMFGPAGHGAGGRVISINLPSFVLADRDRIEKNILIASSTLIQRFHQSASSSDIKVGDFVIVLGTPNTDGEILAKFIRLLPHDND